LTGVVAVLNSFVSAAPALSPSFTVREWHEDDGLPNEVVTDILQDRRGYLWIATAGGLARFDGRHFQRQIWESSQTTRSPFLLMAEMPDGSLFLVPRAGDPLIYRDGTVVAQPLPAPFTGQPVAALYFEADGSRWFALRSGTVLRLGASSVEVFQAKDRISSRVPTSFATDSRHRVWLVSDKALLRYENGRLVPVDVDTRESELRIASSGEGGPWIITNDRVLKLDSSDRAAEITSVPPLTGAHYVSMACEDRNGGLWIATRSQGVRHVTMAGAEHVPTSHDGINVIREDAEGNLWVGTNTGGLNVIGPKIFRLYDKAAGLLENVTYTVCEDSAGDMWFANGDGGVVRVHDGKLDVVAARIGWPTFVTVSVSPDRDGGIWMTGSTGLFHVSANTIQIPSPIAAIPPTGMRRVTFTAKNGDLWLSIDPDRIGRWSDGRFTTYGAAEGFLGHEVRSVAEDELGRIWIGTSDGHLLRWDGSHFENIAVPTTVPCGAINAVHFETDGVVWLGTSSIGIVVLTKTGAQVLDVDHGLPDNNITQLITDNFGHIWCGSRRGIFRLSRSEVGRFLQRQTPWLNATRLGKDEGLKNISCVGIYFPGAASSRDGKLWFATRQGALVIDPAAAFPSPKPPLVVIEEVRSDERRQLLARPMVINPSTRKLEIRFSVLCLSAPARVQTRYRLDGFDGGWLVASDNHVAAYPRLPPGEYQFRVTASFGEVGDQDSTDTLTFIVPPLWWQTAWLRLAVLAALIGAVAAAVRAFSHRRLRRKLEQLERLERESAVERERARIAQNIHDDVGASLTRISLLTQSAHFENTPHAQNLNRIYETTREITRSLDEIVWAVNPQYDTLESFISYLTDYAQNFLSVADVRCRLDFPEHLPSVLLSSQTRHHLFLCCREALNNVATHAQAHEVTLRLQLDARQLTIAIADDGRGLNSPPPRETRDRIRSGNGLANMRRRMADLKGTCTVENAPGGGTLITLQLNLEPDAFGAKTK
jgi:signal transduction histidine kinase/ligand-binding sensor domain-containing protein